MSEELRWDDLRTVLAVARAGSLPAAARELGVNHTTVWRRLAALEEVLGAALFDRPGYEPTPAGEEVVRHAERVEDEVHALMRAVTGHEREAVGRVRLATTRDLADVVVPHLRDFHARHPRVDVDLLLGERLVDLERREADVALRPTLHPPEHAIGRRICDLGWTAYGREGEPWVGFTDDLQHLPVVRWWRERWPGARPVLRVSAIAAMASAVRDGVGNGLMPVFVGDPIAPRLAEPDPAASTRLWLLVHADLRRTARVRAVVDFLSERLASDIPRLEG